MDGMGNSADVDLNVCSDLSVGTSNFRMFSDDQSFRNVTLFVSSFYLVACRESAQPLPATS